MHIDVGSSSVITRCKMLGRRELRRIPPSKSSYVERLAENRLISIKDQQYAGTHNFPWKMGAM